MRPLGCRTRERSQWIHPLSETINGLIAAGMRLDWLHEHDSVPWRMFRCLQRDRGRCLSLAAAALVAAGLLADGDTSEHARRLMEGARMLPRQAASTLDMLRQLERKVLWLSSLHDPPRQPRGRSRRRPEGRRAPGLVRLARHADDGALFPRPAARGPRGRQAAREPGVPRHPVPARQPDARQAAELPRLRRRAVLPLAHQGQGRRRLLDRLGRPRHRRDGLCQPGAGLRARQGLEPGLAQGPHDRHHGRCRDRRRQRARGAARILEARPRELLVDHRLQPPEPRLGGLRPPVHEDGRPVREPRLEGRAHQVRQAAAARLRRARRPAPQAVDRRLPQHALLGAGVPGRRGLAAAAGGRPRHPSRHARPSCAGTTMPRSPAS